MPPSIVRLPLRPVLNLATCCRFAFVAFPILKLLLPSCFSMELHNLRFFYDIFACLGKVATSSC